jgi:hypothetical protein
VTPQTQAILQSARIAELRVAANALAAACKRPTPVILPRMSSSARDRRLLLLLARERRRSARLVAELMK